MKNLTVIFILVFVVSDMLASVGKNELLSYELKCAGVGNEGIYLAEVSAVQQDKPENVEIAVRKAAFLGVILKGISASDVCGAQRSLATEKEAGINHAVISEMANDIQICNTYINVIPGSLLIVKIGKKMYRIKATVSIQKDALRSMLEERKILQGFDDLF